MKIFLGKTIIALGLAFYGLIEIVQGNIITGFAMSLSASILTVHAIVKIFD